MEKKSRKERRKEAEGGWEGKIPPIHCHHLISHHMGGDSGLLGHDLDGGDWCFHWACVQTLILHSDYLTRWWGAIPPGNCSHGLHSLTCQTVGVTFDKAAFIWPSCILCRATPLVNWVPDLMIGGILTFVLSDGGWSDSVGRWWWRQVGSLGTILSVSQEARRLVFFRYSHCDLRPLPWGHSLEH